MSQSHIENELSNSTKSLDSQSNYLAMMTHEIRTPLNGIVGMVGLLTEEKQSAPQFKQYLQILNDCTKQLSSLMNDILDISRIGSNKLNLSIMPFKVDKVVTDAINIVSSQAAAKSLTLECSVDSFPKMLGDQQRIVQILTNLLTNAIKFTDKGGVKIVVTREKDSSPFSTLRPKTHRGNRGSPQASLASVAQPSLPSARSAPHQSRRWIFSFNVTDTGVGIEKEEVEKIFDMYFTDTAHQGSGLGLTISKELASLMGGEIIVSSPGKGKGSTFSLRLLLEEEISIDTLQDKYCKTLSGAQILAVDDKSENRLMLIDLLSKWGCRPVVVSTGREALAYLERMIFSVMIIDVCPHDSPPHLTGIELAQEMRVHYPNIPLIALSSPDNNTSGMQIFDHWLLKPIEQDTLFVPLVRSLTSTSSSFLDLPTFQKTKKRKKKHVRVMIVDDDHASCVTEKQILIKGGYCEKRIETFTDPEKALQRMRITKYKFTAILLDIIMPKKSGLEFAKEAKNSSRGKSLHIIAITAAHTIDTEKCREAGIDGFLTKPISKEKLLSAMKVVTRD